MNIDTSNKKVTVWIAKVPKYIGEKMMQCEEETVMGTLSIDRTETGVSLGIKLSDEMLSTGIPAEHIIDVKQRDGNAYIIGGVPESISIDGCIDKECFIRPVINAEYLSFKKSQKTENVESEVKIIDYFTEIRKGEKYGSLKELDSLAKKRKVMLQEKKRERLDSQDVLDMIFNAYEQHNLWTVKDLADFTGQPVAYIQELVSDICVLNKKDHKNSYELKPEYRHNN